MHRLSAPLLALALLGAFALAACGDDNGGDETPTVPPVTQVPQTNTPAAIETAEHPTPVVQDNCSAAGMSPAVNYQPALPAPVSVLTQEIVAAAVTCNYDVLEQLALAGGPVFEYSFGDTGGSEPAAFWRSAEARGEDVLANLVEVLNMPATDQDGSFAWPFAFTLDFTHLSDADRAMLKQYFSDEEIANWQQVGGYLGYRAIITEGGDWTAFIAGD